MRRLSEMFLVIMAVLSILGVQTTAGAASNPETFNSYSIGTWSPAEAKDGWKLGGFGSKENNGNLISTDIKEGGIDGKYLRVVAGGWNGSAMWKASLDKNKIPKQVVEITFRMIEKRDGELRFGASLQIGPNYWDTIAGVCFENKGSAAAVLSSTSTEALPGGTAWSPGDWLTVQIEINYTDETVRARFGPAGGKFHDWTKPVFMKLAGQYDTVGFLYNGMIDVDNLKILPGSN